MDEFDPGWKEYREYPEFEEAMRPHNTVAMLYELMEEANRRKQKVFVIFNQVIERRGNRALYSPEYEGELVGIEEGDRENYLLLKNVNVMHQEDSPDPKEVLTYTTLERHITLRVPISTIADIMGGNERLGNDYL